MYNKHHFFHPNPIQRYSLGTKSKNLVTNSDGSITLYASVDPPRDSALHNNWLPTPPDDYSLFLRAYWPGPAILDRTWTPPPVRRVG